jgi:uncharacterized protein YjbJ (UPF0337 family)
MPLGRIDLRALRGIGEKARGLTKELVGTVLDNDRLQREGEAEQEKAAESLKALRKQIQAEAKETNARTAEQRERAAQRAKESSSSA